MRKSCRIVYSFIRRNSQTPKLPSRNIKVATTPLVFILCKLFLCVNSFQTAESRANIPLGALLVENTACTVRARDGGILSEGDAAAAVAADIGHDVTDLVVVAGAAALAGVGGGDLVLFTGHFEAVVWVGVWLFDAFLVVEEKIGGGIGHEGGDGKVWTAELGGERWEVRGCMGTYRFEWTAFTMIWASNARLCF
ncbi:hypothetical protein H9L39_13258 [Fusarium oxysporum f. sp. albedinis]|nr:hypothetical protein H9L39_13258 [Fusarium oxysporum f. sp. albedinis]